MVVPTLYIRNCSVRIPGIFDTIIRKMNDMKVLTLIVEGVRDFVPAPREKAFFGLNMKMPRKMNGKQIVFKTDCT